MPEALGGTDMRKWIAFGSAIAFIALASCVDLGLLSAFDATVRDWARPHDVWGPAQLRADLVVEGLRPVMVAALLAVFTMACCVKRRSLRPAAYVGIVCTSAVTLTVAAKIAVGRPDPHGLLATDGGSFPSGHMIGVIIGLGLVVLLVLPSARRWVWLIPALGGGVMAACLLLQAAHWSTDIVGGALLATGVLAVASAPRWTHWLHSCGENDHTSEESGLATSDALTTVGPVDPNSRAG
jgi:membrane-associated phospholipid phosphatase